jgi:ribonuclease HI
MKLTIFADGLTEPVNPNGYGCCAFVVFEGDVSGRAEAKRPDPIHSAHACIARPGDKVTNNVCEYRSVRAALRWVVANAHKAAKDRDVEIRTDSQLVVNQVVGSWQCNADHLRVFRDECREMIRQLNGKVSLVWVRRDENDVADALTRLAYEKARNGSVQRSEQSASR